MSDDKSFTVVYTFKRSSGRIFRLHGKLQLAEKGVYLYNAAQHRCLKVKINSLLDKVRGLGLAKT